MNNQQETLNTLILSAAWRFNLADLAELYRRVGSATALIDHHNDIRSVCPDASPRLVEVLKDLSQAQRIAEEELAYCDQHHIRILTIDNEDYPRRLADTIDAPLALFYIGNGNLNERRTVNIVGTRRCTTYGKDVISRLVAQLHALCPDMMIFSGLAYGIDICAHRAALQNNMPTVGVLAHGLDTIYPSSHRHTAVEMIEHGGLLTEYFTHTQPVARNFIQRNRIVAGCADATILVESAAKGGGLITCNIARSYGRDVFAVPGPVNATYSEGCNNLIRDNGAALISSAEDLVKAMGWDDDERLAKAQQQGIQRELFPDLSTEERNIVEALQKSNDLQVNLIAVKTGMDMGTLSATLFGLEMKGLVKLMAGGTYHLIG